LYHTYTNRARTEHGRREGTELGHPCRARFPAASGSSAESGSQASLHLSINSWVFDWPSVALFSPLAFLYRDNNINTYWQFHDSILPEVDLFSSRSLDALSGMVSVIDFAMDEEKVC
jgi:hypothetical protein